MRGSDGAKKTSHIAKKGFPKKKHKHFLAWENADTLWWPAEIFTLRVSIQKNVFHIWSYSKSKKTFDFVIVFPLSVNPNTKHVWKLWGKSLHATGKIYWILNLPNQHMLFWFNVFGIVAKFRFSWRFCNFWN